MSVLRRILAMRAAHAGWPGPGFPSWLSPATWWTATVAPCSHSSHHRLRSRWISSLRGGWTGTEAGSVMTARRSCRKMIPPNRATRSRLPSRRSLASKQVRGPSLVVTFAWWRAAILVTEDRCLAGRVGRPARSRVQAGLFRAASLQTQHAPFSALSFPAIYVACATGAAWMYSWQLAQTMSVLRRIFAMSAAHAGWPGPGFPSSLRRATWWTATVVPERGLAEFAFPLAEPLDQLLAGVGCRGGRGVADDRPPVLPQGDPAESCYQVRLALSVLPGLEAGPQSVTGLDLGLGSGRYLGDGGAVFCRKG